MEPALSPPRAAAVAWSVVIPVKVLAEAKSRLAALTVTYRARLALAMAADTVAAALAAAPVAAVIAVTDDAVVGAELRALGAVVIADAPAAGLNAALAYGAAYSGRRWPERGRAAMAGDLPALRPAELALALDRAAAAGEAFVPDAAGTGTTVYAAGPGTAFAPAFGPGSRDRHRAAGAKELDLPGLRGIRQDVDTPGDLQLAAALGVGPRTAAALRSGPP
jgi:2-phospho-L-lactate guanylyltransferase